MNDELQAIENFQAAIRVMLPEFASYLGEAVPDGMGNYVVLEIPDMLNPNRKLEVLYMENCFQISFFVEKTRGPAEWQISVENNLVDGVEATISFLRDLASGRIVVDIVRSRILWFQPCQLAFFREQSRIPNQNVIQTILWNSNKVAR